MVALWHVIMVHVHAIRFIFQHFWGPNIYLAFLVGASLRICIYKLKKKSFSLQWRLCSTGRLTYTCRKPKLIVTGRWDATKNSLFFLLNKWALGCDFIAASSDIIHALIGAVWEGGGRWAWWEYACSSLQICMHVQTISAFVCTCHQR